MAAATETASPRSRGLDTWTDADVLAALWESQADALAAVRGCLATLAAAAAAAATRLSLRGRLVYAGAGSSGRLAFQDGVELGPTFGWPDERLLVLLAGGNHALRHAVEGAEDDTDSARAVIETHEIEADDVVVGIAASGATPFTVAALRHARARGALTIAVSNASGPLLDIAEHGLLAETGAEVIAGSTRLKAGTAQKIMLNLFSTLLMTRLGRVHDGRMVGMRLSNDKLRKRARIMVGDIAGTDEATAGAALATAQGDIKHAVLIAAGHTPERARIVLNRHGGNLRAALQEDAG